MRIVIFGLSVSSAWGNGHATIWRSLIAALDEAGARVTFFERDAPYYRAHRDLSTLPGRAELRLYGAWDDIAGEAADAVANCDAAIVTSYCPDAQAASDLVRAARATRVYYDLDTPVTLSRLEAGDVVPYLPEQGLADFDLVLSFTGGSALVELAQRLAARHVAPLYGSVDPSRHYPVAGDARWRGACSYLGTWSADRQAILEALFLEPARRRGERFVLGGAQYPEDVVWPANIARVEHVAPDEHAAFYCASPLTLNATRAPMATRGYCPSGRLFEAAACGVPVLSDAWPGLAEFFAPGDEILVAETTDDALAALERPRAELARIGRRARTRAVEQHTSTHRAAELIELIERHAPRHGAWS